MAALTQTVANMVQGVSQQAAQERRNTQCEAQFDCLNQAVQGAVARYGFNWVKKLDAGDYTDAFWYDIMRSRTERYSVAIKNGVLKAWNMVDGTSCTINDPNNVDADYLVAMGGSDKDWDNWAATTANDETFIANKKIKPLMAATLSAARPKEALFWFRAGGYKTQYTIGIKLSGTWYNYSYTTPDNSVAGNAQYITTNQLCYNLYNAMITDLTHPLVSGTGNLGFSAQRQGNIMRIWRTDALDFDITTEDGNNNTQLSGIKEKVGGLDGLPINGFDGMLFKVAGDATDTSDDWYVQFDDAASAHDSTTQGGWVEVVNQATPINLNSHKMPITLFNDGLNEFTLDYGTWGARLAGDGIDSAVDPSFVGVKVQDIFYDQTRLALMTEFSVVWSRVKNPFVYFPDTVQTTLDSAPIDAQIQQSKGISILKRPVQTNGFTMLWAEDKQLVVSHGDNSVFSNNSIEVDTSSSYSWNEDIAPVPLGTSLLFATSDDTSTQITDVTFQQGQVVDDTGITDHVPTYLPADARELAASDTAKKVVLWAPSTPNLLYVYEYRKTKQDRLQSAWHTWRLPTQTDVLHAVFDRSTLYLHVNRPDGLHLLKTSFSPNQIDTGYTYKVRMDFRVTEAECVVAYDSGADETTIVLPYQADDASDWLDGIADLVLVARESNTEEGHDPWYRGEQPSFTANTVGAVTTLTLTGDWSDLHFYAGFRIRSERKESTFYRRDDQTGYIYVERIGVARGELIIQDTAYTRVEVRLKDGSLRYRYEFEGKVLGQQSAVFDTVGLATTKYPFSVGLLNEDHSVTFVNDTPYPSAWQGLTWMYNPTVRTAP